MTSPESSVELELPGREHQADAHRRRPSPEPLRQEPDRFETGRAPGASRPPAQNEESTAELAFRAPRFTRSKLASAGLFLITAALVLLAIMRATNGSVLGTGPNTWARLTIQAGDRRTGTLLCDGSVARGTGHLGRPKAAAAACEAVATSPALRTGELGCSDVSGGGLPWTGTIKGRAFDDPVDLTIDCYGAAWFELLPLFEPAAPGR